MRMKGEKVKNNQKGGFIQFVGSVGEDEDNNSSAPQHVQKFKSKSPSRQEKKTIDT